MADNTTDPTAQKPSLTAPMAVMSSGGGNSLLPTQKLNPRQATNVAEGIVVAKEDYTSQGYVGQNLVDKTGTISRAQYGNEAYAQLAEFKSVKERQNFLERLRQVGLYGNSKPSQTGFESRDLGAMQDALNWANWRGYTIDVAATLMATELPKVANGGNRIRTTPKEDLRAVFKNAAGSVLGRQLSDSEVEKFIKSYNQKEVNEAGGGAFAPTASVAAEQAVIGAAPEEAQAMGALSLTNIFDSVIKGLG
jgi:hypothetical protein